MSWLEHVHALARYNKWMNLKVYAAAARLSDEERKRDRAAFFKSIHGTLNHLLLADATWLGRFSGGDPRMRPRDVRGEPIVISALAQELYADFDELTRERARLDALILDYVADLDEPRLAAPFSYKGMNGAPQQHTLWWALAHFFNHQTHHRGQVTTLLSQAGIDVGATDLVFMLREEAAASART